MSTGDCRTYSKFTQPQRRKGDLFDQCIAPGVPSDNSDSHGDSEKLDKRSSKRQKGKKRKQKKNDKIEQEEQNSTINLFQHEQEKKVRSKFNGNKKSKRSKTGVIVEQPHPLLYSPRPSEVCSDTGSLIIEPEVAVLDNKRYFDANNITPKAHCLQEMIKTRRQRTEQKFKNSGHEFVKNDVSILKGVMK